MRAAMEDIDHSDTNAPNIHIRIKKRRNSKQIHA